MRTATSTRKGLKRAFLRRSVYPIRISWRWNCPTARKRRGTATTWKIPVNPFCSTIVSSGFSTTRWRPRERSLTANMPQSWRRPKNARASTPIFSVVFQSFVPSWRSKPIWASVPARRTKRGTEVLWPYWPKRITPFCPAA